MTPTTCYSCGRAIGPRDPAGRVGAATVCPDCYRIMRPPGGTRGVSEGRSEPKWRGRVRTLMTVGFGLWLLPVALSSVPVSDGTAALMIAASMLGCILAIGGAIALFVSA